MTFSEFYNFKSEPKIEKKTNDEVGLSSLEDVFLSRLNPSRKLIDYVPRDKAWAIIGKNVDLIKTIPSPDAHKRIVWYIVRVFLGVYSREDLIAYLMKIGGIDEDRAEMIADDQIHKATELFLVEKWKSKGCKRVRWIHEGASNPRQYHLRAWNGKSGKRNGRPNGLNGYEFPIDKPPVINPETKERGYPGQMINCHCKLIPIWEV